MGIIMDYNSLEPKEILSKLHEISSKIIGLYEEMIRLVEEGKSIDQCIEVTTALKLLIIKETVIINSLSKETVLSCRLAIKGIGAIIPMMDPTIEYNLGEDDLFEFPEDESIEIKNRVVSRLFGANLVKENRTITIRFSIGEKQTMPVKLGDLSTFRTLIDIKLIKRLKEQFEKGYTNIDMDSSLNSALKRNLNIWIIKMLMSSYELEFFIFLFYSSPKIDETIDNSIELIELALSDHYDNNGKDIIGNLGEKVIEDLSKINIDVSSSSFVIDSDTNKIYEYISNITKLDILLIHATMASLEQINHFFEGGQTKGSLISFALEHGLTAQAESLEQSLDDDFYRKYVNFKSPSVEAVIREMLKKSRQRLLSQEQNQ